MSTPLAFESPLPVRSVKCSLLMRKPVVVRVPVVVAFVEVPEVMERLCIVDEPVPRMPAKVGVAAV